MLRPSFSGRGAVVMHSISKSRTAASLLSAAHLLRSRREYYFRRSFVRTKCGRSRENCVWFSLNAILDCVAVLNPRYWSAWHFQGRKPRLGGYTAHGISTRTPIVCFQTTFISETLRTNKMAGEKNRILNFLSRKSNTAKFNIL